MGNRGIAPPFMTSALDKGEWSASRPGRFTPGERALGTHWIGGRVNPRAGLDDVEKRKFLTLPGLELRPLCRPALSQSLYRLSYPGSKYLYVQILFQLLLHPVRSKTKSKYCICKFFMIHSGRLGFTCSETWEGVIKL
jgi:hypothetical protein